MKWLRELSVGKKFSIVIGIILMILFFGLVNFWLSLKIMSGIRAYVGGEGLWSKAQKAAINSLIKYSVTSDPNDYLQYQKFLQIPLGDKQARLELDKNHSDYEVIKQGFIQGGNNPADVSNLIFLYQNFKTISYMKVAIQDWQRGDQKMGELIVLGDKIHSLISTSNIPDSTKSAQLVASRGSVYVLDTELTELENHFSATLSDGSRWIATVLLLLTLVMTVVMGSIAVFTAMYIGQMIVQIDRMKSEFVAMASHELRTPMSAIKGYVAMILANKYGAITSQLRDPLQQISLSIERLIGLANDLLDLARIDSKGLHPNLVDSTSHNIIKDVIESLRPIALQKNLILTTGELDEKIVQIDPGFLRQILHNLLGNAVKFTSQGTIVVSSTSRFDRQIISVTDSGPGIQPKDQLKIFSRFQQIPLSSQKRPPGTGLGLYISTELAKKMGAKLSLIQSEIGKGSTFVVSLPLSNSALAQKVNTAI